MVKIKISECKRGLPEKSSGETTKIGGSVCRQGGKMQGGL